MDLIVNNVDDLDRLSLNSDDTVEFNVEDWGISTDYNINQIIGDEDETFDNIYKNHQQLPKYPLYMFEFMIRNNLLDHFNLTDIIMLAGLYRRIAKIAYELDCMGFQNFCDSVYMYNILDFTQLDHISEQQFLNIEKRYYPADQIFSTKMPNSFLLHLKNSESYTFNLHPSQNTLMRSSRNPPNNNLLIINGNSLDSSNQILEILYSLPRTKKLHINNFKFDGWVSASIRNLSLDEIVILNSKCKRFKGDELAKAILKSRNTLRDITIGYDQTYRNNLLHTTNYILSEAHNIKNLNSISICANESQSFLANIWKLKKCKNLRMLVIHNLNHRFLNTEIERNIKHYISQNTQIRVMIDSF